MATTGKPSAVATPSTLTSEVYNEAELIFQILEHKEKKLISYLDCLTLLRGMGMNPTTAVLEDMYETMKAPIAEAEAIRLAEEVKREKERKAAEKKDPKKEKAEKEKAEKEAAEKKKAEEEAAAAGGEPKKKVLAEPAEEVKNITWSIFIHAVEPIYSNNQKEEEKIVEALKTFDKTGTGSMSRDQLIKILTENGESVLSPAEIKQLKEAFPNETIEFTEFAKRIQGTYQGPSAEELAKKAEKERLEREAAAKAAAAAQEDPLLAPLSVPGL